METPSVALPESASAPFVPQIYPPNFYHLLVFPGKLRDVLCEKEFATSSTKSPSAKMKPIIPVTDVHKLLSNDYVRANITNGREYSMLQSSLFPDTFLVVAFRYRTDTAEHPYITLNTGKTLNLYPVDELASTKTLSSTDVKTIGALISLFGGNASQMQNVPLFCVLIFKKPKLMLTDADAKEIVDGLLLRRFLNIQIVDPKCFLTLEYSKPNIDGLINFRKSLAAELESRGLETTYDIHLLNRSTKEKTLIESESLWREAMEETCVDLLLTATRPGAEPQPEPNRFAITATKEAKYLRIVDLSNCKVTDEMVLSVKWSGFAVEDLTLSGNYITKLHSRFFEARGLRRLNLSRNQIVDIDVQIGEMKANNPVSVKLRDNKVQRLRCDAEFPWLKSIHSLDLRGNPIFDFPNDVILWLLDGGILRANTQIEDPAEHFLRDLNHSPLLHCYMCTGKHPLYISEVRQMKIPMTKVKTEWFQFGPHDKTAASGGESKVQRIPLRISSHICKKCWQRLEREPTGKFCWLCLQKVPYEGTHNCPVKRAQQLQSALNASSGAVGQPTKVLSGGGSSSTTTTTASPSPLVSPHDAAGAAQLDANDTFDPNAPFRCDLCRVVCTSQETLDYHLQGKKHLHRVELKLNTTYCILCDVRATNAHGFEMHVRGQKHRKKYNAMRFCIQLPSGRYGELVPSSDGEGHSYFMYKDPDWGDFVFTVDPKKESVVVPDRPLFGRDRFPLMKKKHGVIVGMPEVPS